MTPSHRLNAEALEPRDRPANWPGLVPLPQREPADTLHPPHDPGLVHPDADGCTGASGLRLTAEPRVLDLQTTAVFIALPRIYRDAITSTEDPHAWLRQRPACAAGLRNWAVPNVW